MDLNFKNTNEALIFGKKHRGDLKKIELMRLVLGGIEAAKKEVKDKDDQAYLNLICKAQFIKEAIQEAEIENKAVEPITVSGCAEV